MEESDKMNGKKHLPSIPSNYVTLLQLRERWNKEKERIEKEKEEKQEPQQQQEKKEPNVEERVNEEVSGIGSRKNRRFPRDNGKRVAKGKPRDEKTATAEDLDSEKKGKEKKTGWKKLKKKTRDELKGKAWIPKEGENVGNAPSLLPTSMERDKAEEELIVNEVHAPKLAIKKEDNVEARRVSLRRSNLKTYWRKAKIERKFQEEDELVGDEVHAPKLESVAEDNIVAKRESRPRLISRIHGCKAEIGRKFQTTERNKGEEELTVDKVQAPKLASFEEEDVESRREPGSHSRFNPRTHGHTAEIGRKFQAMSVKGDMRRWDDRRYCRQHFNFNHRCGNPRKEGMVWVKKGEVEDQNVSGVQSSSKELD